MTQAINSPAASVMDVTAQVDFQNNDDENLPLTKCVCGKKFPLWQEVLSIYPDNPWACPDCGAKLYFSVSLRVFQVP